jgi:hypothetical protein
MPGEGGQVEVSRAGDAMSRSEGTRIYNTMGFAIGCNGHTLRKKMFEGRTGFRV